MFGVIGPDGAGKTTTHAADLRAARAGRRHGPRARRSIRFASTARPPASIGYLSQRFSLYGDLSIDENIAFFAEIHGVRDFAAAARPAARADAAGAVPRRGCADRLSGGMKQKLALACTLVHEPPLLVLDEPTTGVDPVSRREFWKLLAEFLSQGLTIVMATPYLDEAERCARVALLNEGRLLALDEPAHLQAAMSGAILEIVATPPRQALQMLRAQSRRASACSCSAIACTSASIAKPRARVRWLELERAGLRGRERASDRADARGRLHRAAGVARAAGPSPAAPAAGSRR